MNQFINSFYQKHFQKIYNHAFLLVGPPLSGKFFLACEIAKKLQNTNSLSSSNTIIIDQLYQKGKLEDEEILSQSSNIDQSHRKKKGTSTDIITIDDMGMIINEINNRLSFDNTYKIVIINNLHRLNNEASNKLLKTLEEPPANCLFLFTTNNLFQVLDTIKSRVTVLAVPQVGSPEILNCLESTNIPSLKKELISKLAGSYLYKAQQLSENAELLEKYEQINQQLEDCWQNKKIAPMWEQFSSFESKDWNIFWDVLSSKAYQEQDFRILKKIENYFNLVLRGKANQTLLACDVVLDICY